MIRVHHSVVVDAPVDKVWGVVLRFDGTWFVPDATNTVRGDALRIGAIRDIGLPSGDVIVEQLLALDTVQRTLTYSIVSGPFPIYGYIATLKVHAITDGDRSFVEWRSSFEFNDGTVAAARDATVAAINNVYVNGLRSLKQTKF